MVYIDERERGASENGYVINHLLLVCMLLYFVTFACYDALLLLLDPFFPLSLLFKS